MQSQTDRVLTAFPTGFLSPGGNQSSGSRAAVQNEPRGFS